MTDYNFQTHEPWCDRYLYDDFSYCSCGYQEDFYVDDEPKYAGSNPGEEYGAVYQDTPYGRRRIA